MKCPICKKATAPGEPHFPFCSERCKVIDLGNWATGKYVISTPLRPESEDDEAERRPPREHDPEEE